jgi:uncharacterized protein
MKEQKCPICKKKLKKTSSESIRDKYFPFCSERCKLVDLGAWFDSDYKVISPVPDKSSQEDDKE